MKRILLIVPLFFVLLGHGSAQSNASPQAELALQQRGDSVLIRWAPNNYKLWRQGNQYGWILRRVLINADELVDTNGVDARKYIEFQQVFKPRAESFWDSLPDTFDAAMIAQECLYGDSIQMDFGSGSDLLNYRDQNKIEQNRFAMSLMAADQSLEVAGYLGLFFVDTTAVAGDHYAYVLSVLDAEEETKNVGIGRVEGASVNLETPVIQGSAGNKSASIVWKDCAPENRYLGYDIYRSADQGLSWQKRNNKPFMAAEGASETRLFLVYQDSLPSNDTLYTYKVSGRTIFENAGPFSDTIKVQGYAALFTEIPFIDSIRPNYLNSVNIFWSFPDSLDALVSLFNVYYSESIEGPYILLSSAAPEMTTREMEFEEDFSSWYFKIVAIDLDGFEHASFPALGQTADSLPPEAPQELAGFIENDGRMMLTWSPENSEPLSGYQVYLAHEEDGLYLQISETIIADTSFIRAINVQTLQKKLYVKIRALDRRGNLSGFSESVELAIPDKVPPSKPAWTEHRSDLDGNELRWINSASDDLAQAKLQRKIKGSGDWATLQTTTPAPASAGYYRDTTSIHKTRFEYRVLNYDAAANVSSSALVELERYNSGQRAPAKPFSGELLTITDTIYDFTSASQPLPNLVSRKAVRLSWDAFKEDSYLYGIEVYRGYTIYNASLVSAVLPGVPNLSSGDQPMRLFRTLSMKEDTPNFEYTSANAQQWAMEFVDREVIPGREYTYKLILVYSDGGSSEISQAVTIRVTN